MYYKYQYTALPWPESYGPIDIDISYETFTHLGTCIGEAMTYNFDVPCSWGGPYLQILKSSSKQALIDLYYENRVRDLTSYGNEITIIPYNKDDGSLHLLRDMCPNIEL